MLRDRERSSVGKQMSTYLICQPSRKAGTIQIVLDEIATGSVYRVMKSRDMGQAFIALTDGIQSGEVGLLSNNEDLRHNPYYGVACRLKT